MQVWLGGIGLAGPGLAGWAASRSVLTGSSSYVAAPTAYAVIENLPPAERRRLGVPIKLALGAGLDAFRSGRHDPRSMATVFTSSGGDGENVNKICESLATTDREVSPTRFHNAVHNAAAGYWSITTGSQSPSTSLCCHDGSFAAGLLEAAAQVTADARPVALIAYDHRYPQPLHAVRPIGADLGIAMILLPAPDEHVLAKLEITVVPPRSTPDLAADAHGKKNANEPETAMADPALDAMRITVPVGRALPLLAAVARGVAATVWMNYLEMRLGITVSFPGSVVAEE